MTNMENHSGNGANLRRLAEETVHKGLGFSKQRLDSIAGEETRLVFHELYLHQIEMEMQNEELRRIQSDLEREKARYRDLYEMAPVGYCTLSTQGLILETNACLAGLLEVPQGQLSGRPLSGFIHIEDQPLFHAQPKLALSACGPQVCELRMIRRSGVVFWVHLATAAAGAASSSMVFRLVISDITARKLAEQALRLQEERYRRIVETAQEGIWVLNRHWRTVYSNRRLGEMLGYTAEEMHHKPARDFFFPEDGPEHAERLKERRQGNDAIYECRLRHRQGHAVWVRISATANMDDQGAFDGSIAMCTDISDRKQAEDALRQSEHLAREAKNLLTLVLDTVPVRLFWKDLTSVYLGCNRLFAQDAGLQVPEEVIGLDDFSMAWKDQAELYRADDHAVITSGLPKLDYEEEQTTADGRRISLRTSKVPLRTADGHVIGILGAYEDITRRKWAEEELLKARKLEAAALLTEGIAHSFNNILMVMMGNIAFAKMRISPDDQAFARLSVAEDEALKAKELTRQILAFAKGGEPVRRSLPVERVISSVSRLNPAASASACVVSLAEDLWPIHADEIQISQALANILINADQAMEGGGTIRIVCENAEIDETGALPLPQGRYVRISIIDQGRGIAEEHLERIFDPYFTTRGQGHGFGLAAAYSIIRSHGGIINVQSVEGAGTTFTLLVPAAAEAKEDTAPSPAPSKGSGRILVMDDEQAVRQITGAMLANLGYSADFASHGEEVLEKYRAALESGTPYAAVIMDLVVVHGMGGRETIGPLLKADPGARVIISSGFCADPVMTGHQDFGFKGMIAKPYRQADLARQLQEVLGA